MGPPTGYNKTKRCKIQNQPRFWELILLMPWPEYKRVNYEWNYAMILWINISCEARIKPPIPASHWEKSMCIKNRSSFIPRLYIPYCSLYGPYQPKHVSTSWFVLFVSVDNTLAHHDLISTGEMEFVIGLDKFLYSNRYQTISIANTPHVAVFACSGSVAVRFT